jgi:hypothetical protein
VWIRRHRTDLRTGRRRPVQGRTCVPQAASLDSPYPKCAASIPSDAIRLPCACSCRTGRPHPWRIAHSRVLGCRPYDVPDARDGGADVDDLLPISSSLARTCASSDGFPCRQAARRTIPWQHSRSSAPTGIPRLWGRYGQRLAPLGLIARCYRHPRCALARRLDVLEPQNDLHLSVHRRLRLVPRHGRMTPPHTNTDA